MLEYLDLFDTSNSQVHLETPRARLTLLLSQYHENLSNQPASSTPAPTSESSKAVSPRDSLQTASDLLSELQVETYSSMERKEKTEFLLEQMRLLVLVARTKDREGKEANDANENGKGLTPLSGETEWIKVRVGGRKVHEGFLSEDGNEVIRFSYLFMMTHFSDIVASGIEIQILRLDDPTCSTRRGIP